jgi:polysaccharide deacetylase 2 family uncharacterized protein YibQ
MKFKAKIPKTDKASLSPSTFVAGVLTFFLVISLIIVVSGIFLGREGRVEQALLSAKRLEIDLNSGEVFGEVLKTKPDKTASDKQEGDAVADKASPSADGNKSDKTQNSHFAWLDEDFIGPRMPKSFVDTLIESATTNIKIEKVSLKELSDKPIIVVILKGMGLSASTTEMALQLPVSVNFGISPYSSSIQQWVEKAKEQGREVVLNVPMETKDYRLNDPGPYALMTQSSPSDNITRLNMLLDLVAGYQAIYSDGDEIFTHTLASSKPVLQELKKKRKYLVFGGGYADFSLVQLANELEYPLLVNDFVLDEQISEEAINEKFKEIEKEAVEKGYVVVMAHPYPITIRMLERWLPLAEKRGFFMAPVSLLIGKQITKD